MGRMDIGVLVNGRWAWWGLKVQYAELEWKVISMKAETLGETYLASTSDSVPQARSEVRRWLGCDHPAVEEVILVISELVTNAIIYSDQGNAGDLIGVSLTATEDFLHVEVSDPGSALTAPHLSREMTVQPRMSAEGGRGLFIVDALSRGRWGIREHGRGMGRTVWCEIPVPLASGRSRSPGPSTVFALSD
ncbi:ATP-binding protein [Streptosporangium lutulentum]